MPTSDCPQLKIALAKLKDLKAELDAAFKIGKEKRDFGEAKNLQKEMELKIEEINDMLGVREVKATVKLESDANFGKEIVLNFEKELKHWKDFYQESGIDRVKLPDEIIITHEQAAEMKRMIEELGFNKILIIPDNLVGEPEVKEVNGKKVLKKPAEHYEELHKKMSEEYAETSTGGNYDNDAEDKDGNTDHKFGASQDKRKGLRIILTKDAQTLREDELFKETINKSVEDLEAGIFKEKRVSGLSESEYLVYQREYFKGTGEHLDDWDKGNCYTWLPGSRRPASGRVPDSYWNTDHRQLEFSSGSRGSQSGILGCRLAGNFSLEVI